MKEYLIQYKYIYGSIVPQHFLDKRKVSSSIEEFLAVIFDFMHKEKQDKGMSFSKGISKTFFIFWFLLICHSQVFVFKICEFNYLDLGVG